MAFALLILYAHSATLDNCLKYVNDSLSISTKCLICRDGFYINDGQCKPCTSKQDSPDCSKFPLSSPSLFLFPSPLTITEP